MAIAIFLAALALRLTLLFALPDYGRIPPMEMERVARSFATTGELANPYATPTGPTAHVLPVYPILLGTIYRIWGTGDTGRLAQGVWGCTLAALRCGLLYLLVLFMGLGYRVAFLSAILSAVYIPAFATEIHGGWEAPLAALFLMGTVYLTMRLISGRQLRLPNAILYGCWVGLSALLSATLLAAASGLIVAGMWVFRRNLRRYLLWCGILLTVVVLCLTPWALRNRSQLGHAVWLRSNLGLELWQAYHDGAAYGALDADARIGPALDPVSSNQVRAAGELAYHQMMRDKAVGWIQAHPREAIERTIVHAMYFWFPPATVLPVRMLRGLLTALAVCGILLLLSKRSPSGYVMAVIWISFPLIYYVVYWSSRYRYPMEWTLVVAAAVALSAAGDMVRKARSAGRPSQVI